MREPDRSYCRYATGRRISAICRLHYGDLQLADGTPFGSIRWRAETDKTGRETTVPINANEIISHISTARR